MKNKTIATFLNLLPFGFGYVYLGMRRKFLTIALIGIACPFIGVVLAVILDALIPWVLNVSGLSQCDFNYWYAKCQRPYWVTILMLGSLILPSIILSINSAKKIRRIDNYFN